MRGRTRNNKCKNYAKDISEKAGDIQIRFGIWLTILMLEDCLRLGP